MKYYFYILLLIIASIFSIIITICIALPIALLLFLLSEFFYWVPLIGKYLTILSHSVYDIAFAPIGMLMALQAWLFRDKVIIREKSFIINNPKYTKEIKYIDIKEVDIYQLGMNIILNLKFNDKKIDLLNCDKWEDLEKVFITNNISINNRLYSNSSE